MVRSYGERAHEVAGQVDGSLAHVCGVSSATKDRKRGEGKEWLSDLLSLNPDSFLFPLRFNFSQMLALSVTLLRHSNSTVKGSVLQSG